MLQLGEHLSYQLAGKCGIDVPEMQLVIFANKIGISRSEREQMSSAFSHAE